MKQLAALLLMKIVVNSLLFLTDQSALKLACFKCAVASVVLLKHLARIPRRHIHDVTFLQIQFHSSIGISFAHDILIYTKSLNCGSAGAVFSRGSGRSLLAFDGSDSTPVIYTAQNI